MKIEKNAVIVAPEDTVARLLASPQVEIGRGAVVIGVPDGTTPEQIEAMLKAAVAVSAAPE